MSKKKILILSENRQELECLNDIANEIVKHLPTAEITHVSLDRFYFQDAETYFKDKGLNYIELDYKEVLSTPFPFLNGKDKFEIIRYCMPQIIKLVKDVDAVICGIDGSFQRAFVSKAKKYGKKTFQLLISLIFDQDMKTTNLKDRMIFSILSMFNMNYYYYGKICSAEFDRVYVCGGVVKEALLAGGVREDVIRVSGIPRFASLFESCEMKKSKAGKFRILYISGAFGWHRDYEGESIERYALGKLVEIIERDARFEFTIKMHPRADMKCYEWLNDNNHIRIETNRDLAELYSQNDIVMSLRSTCMFESIVNGTPALSLTTSLDRPIDKQYLNEIGKCIALVNVDEMESRLLEYVSDRVELNELLTKEKLNIDRYISANSKESARYIAVDILDNI